MSEHVLTYPAHHPLRGHREKTAEPVDTLRVVEWSTSVTDPVSDPHSEPLHSADSADSADLADLADSTDAGSADAGNTEPALGAVAIVGMGYVGLPTALGLFDRNVAVIGIDKSTDRLDAIRSGRVDVIAPDRERLLRAVGTDEFQLTADQAALGRADVVVICVPTPLDRHLTPDLTALTAACRSVVANARAGQIIILTSTSYAGTTRELITEPLRERGFSIGEDIFVAFSPERIDPGVAEHQQSITPRVVGGVSAECTARAAAVLRRMTDTVHEVSSPEAAEMTKLYENTFRAVTLALANEFAEICGALELDPIEVTLAAATKPYGFLATFPGPGVGGHCIPCDPHYLLWQLRKIRHTAPVTQQAMASIAGRPRHVVDRAAEVLSDTGMGLRGARVLVVGVSYKPGVQDLRESSAIEIITDLQQRGAVVDYHDPLIPQLVLPGGERLDSRPDPDPSDWDLALLHTLHPGHDYAWAAGFPRLLDGTYRFASSAGGSVV